VADTFHVPFEIWFGKSYMDAKVEMMWKYFII
jgi:hypothetical protein